MIFCAEYALEELRARIEPHWGSIFNKILVPCSTTENTLTFKEKVDCVLRHLRKTGRSTQEARCRLATVTTEVIWQEWKEEISELIEGSDANNNYKVQLNLHPPCFWLWKTNLAIPLK